jgi:hypothetical protein
MSNLAIAKECREKWVYQYRTVVLDAYAASHRAITNALHFRLSVWRERLAPAVTRSSHSNLLSGRLVAETIARFLIGGLVVSAFAALGALFKPTSFAELFGAAPSVALATLGLAIAKNGRLYASTECRSMIAGAAALGVYSLCVRQLLMKGRLSALGATLSCTLVWLLTAFGLWGLFLR